MPLLGMNIPWAIETDGNATKVLFEKLEPNALITWEIHPNFRAAIEPQMKAMQQRFKSASSLERKYIYAFSNFLSSELFLAKT